MVMRTLFATGGWQRSLTSKYIVIGEQLEAVAQTALAPRAEREEQLAFNELAERRSALRTKINQHEFA
jgi:hypothetical protein